jgi:UDP-N-acetylmuramoylalanine--D-glutamate ligase
MPTLETVLQAQENDLFVLELSSFQLETLGKEKISPHIAVLTSFSHDHLNRYETMESYLEAKEHIFRWQQPNDAAFWLEQTEWQDHILASIPHDVTKKTLTLQDIRIQMARTPIALPGEHNQANATLAATVARYLGVDQEVLARAIASFTGVPYRQQIIPTEDGFTWINDTTATTPMALLTALKTHQTEKIILIAGGTTKNLPFPNELFERLKNPDVQTVWLTGSGTQELLTKLGEPHTHTCQSLAEAVKIARQKAQELSVKTILFSPGFSSFELFENEFDRGDQFNALIKEISLGL